MLHFAFFEKIRNKKNPRKLLIYRDLLSFSLFKSGETGIRTPGTSQYNGFQDRRNRPLCHLSKTPLLRSASLRKRCKGTYSF